MGKRDRQQQVRINIDNDINYMNQRELRAYRAGFRRATQITSNQDIVCDELGYGLGLIDTTLQAYED